MDPKYYNPTVRGRLMQELFVFCFMHLEVGGKERPTEPIKLNNNNHLTFT